VQGSCHFFIHEQREICGASLSTLYIEEGANHRKKSFIDQGYPVGDLVLVVSFFSMLMVPCWLAMRTVRRENGSPNRSGGIFPVAEGFDDEDHYVLRPEMQVDRRALAIQRSREIYFRTIGNEPSSEYGEAALPESGPDATYLGQM
jgi:hypothetical protein